MLENLDKIMHSRFNFDACPMHSPFGFVHLTHQNLSARALFCLNSLAKVNTQLLIYNYSFFRGTTSPRKEILHNIDPVGNFSALRRGDYKIVIGNDYKGKWDGWFNATDQVYGKFTSQIELIYARGYQYRQPMGQIWPAGHTHLACWPYSFGLLLAPKYMETQRAVLFIWP